MRLGIFINFTGETNGGYGYRGCRGLETVKVGRGELAMCKGKGNALFGNRQRCWKRRRGSGMMMGRIFIGVSSHGGRTNFSCL
ncbi:hypothetical protein GWI33_001660 [Rhynchophorus ferrugineus]|uniref:Uncharacterized protein n=1 Tax=Rhynchophorus ferrugineus TaxID=354439 RepID=A0A834MPF7_RHYFE|nr:hypothetical protein GWI33_001660 [Rhynchophorus ferrugineus]